MKTSERGQVILGAVVLLVIIALLIPAIITYIQNESKWSVKEEHSTRAFQLAETGVERGFQQIILTTSTWQNIQLGIIPAGFQFDQVYTDVAGGTYEIRITSGPQTQQATVIGVGQDSLKTELRAVRAIYTVPGAYPAAIYALTSATITGNPFVEWGPVASPGPITTDASHTHPRYYSSGDVLPFDANLGAPPNTDNIQWWSYYTLPPPAQIDLPGYRTAAGAYVDAGVGSFSGPAGQVYYVSAAYAPTYDPGTNNFVNGTLIVEGNLNLHGHYGNGSMNNVAIPSTAWQEYGNDWAFYRTNYDPGCPYGTFAAAKAANYNPAGLTYANISSVFIHGFLYIGGTISISGGGNANIVGSLYCATVADLGSSHVTVYYDATVINSVKVKNNTLTRLSWQDWTGCKWTGANPTCP